MSLQTDNFVLAWSDPTVPPATIEHAAAALERGWQAFIDEQGWPAPVSADGRGHRAVIRLTTSPLLHVLPAGAGAELHTGRDELLAVLD